MSTDKLLVHGASGGLALATAFAIMHPLDTLKTQLQSNTCKGGKSLFRGITTSTLGAGGQGALRLATYEYVKESLSSLSIHPTLNSAISAICGDFVSSIIKLPREVITARLQVNYDQHLTRNPAYETLKLIIKEQGIRGLFRGFWSTTIRDWPFMVILFTSYENLHRSSQHHEISTMKSTFFGGVSGALAGFLTTPFDVVKTRIMTSKESSIMAVGKNLKEKGIKSFFVGGIARSTWWFCVCSIFFPIYELGKELGGAN